MFCDPDGDRARRVAKPLVEGYLHSVADAAAAAAIAPELLRAGDVVLIKASRGVGLELVCRTLGEKATA